MNQKYKIGNKPPEIFIPSSDINSLINFICPHCEKGFSYKLLPGNTPNAQGPIIITKANFPDLINRSSEKQ